LHELVDAVIAQSWSPSASRETWRGFARSAVRDPSFLQRRMLFRLRARNGGCALARVMRERNRIAPFDRPESFLAFVGRGHRVIDLLQVAKPGAV
jgi:hypothetical protein